MAIGTAGFLTSQDVDSETWRTGGRAAPAGSPRYSWRSTASSTGIIGIADTVKDSTPARAHGACARRASRS